jgi:hypothetical protein
MSDMSMTPLSAKRRVFHSRDGYLATNDAPGGCAVLAFVPWGHNIGQAERTVSAARAAAAFLNDGEAVVDLAGKLATLREVTEGRDKLAREVGDVRTGHNRALEAWRGERNRLTAELTAMEQHLARLNADNAELRRLIETRALDAVKVGTPAPVKGCTLKRPTLLSFLGLPDRAEVALKISIPPLG